jgi:hypothetical protein
MNARLTAIALVACALAMVAGLGTTPWIEGGGIGVGPLGARECIAGTCQSSSLGGLLGFLGFATAGFVLIVAVLACRAAYDLVTRPQPRTPTAMLVAWAAVAVAAILLFCWRMAALVHSPRYGAGVSVAIAGVVGAAVTYRLRRDTVLQT